MNDRKTRRAVPAVEVIRRPAANPGTVAPNPTPTASVTPRPTSPPTPRPTVPTPRPTVPVTPTPTPAGGVLAPTVPRPTPRPTPSTPPSAPPSPPTPAASAMASTVPEPATASASPPITPAAAPRPVSPGPAAPRPAFASSRPPGPGGPPGARPGGFARPRTPRPPPTAEQVIALATKEHVPARIAKGELEGKMKCRIWRKLHAEEAKRFDQVYVLMGQNPGLSLPDGFGVVQSGLTVTEFLARKERTQRKAAVKTARGEVDDSAISAFIQGLIESKTELALVLGERTVLDTVTSVEPISFLLGRGGRQEKLQVVMVTRRSDWEQLTPRLERDPKLTQKPVTAARQPDKRPYSDPRPFLVHQGQTVRLTLRNGIQLSMRLRAVGRFDLLVGEDGHEVFIPLHALVRFSAEDVPEESIDPAGDELESP